MSQSLIHAIPLGGQVINLCAAIMLLLGFAMLAQRRVLTLINLFMLQGLVLFVSTLIVALTTNQSHLL
jgi:hydrogenase-4 component E